MRLTTTFLLVAVTAISGCKTGLRQSAETGCAASCGAASCGATVGVAKVGCADNACTNGACTNGNCANVAGANGACTTSCAATCVTAGQNGCVSGASGCSTTACGACGDTISQAKAARQAKPAPTTQPNPFVTSEIQPTNATVPAEPEVAEPASFEPSTVIYRHAEDYRWLVGQLQRVHTPGAEWKIRYAGLDEHDVWGGSMVLARDVRLESFQDGQLVYVEGEILAERPSAYLSGPLYRMDTIRPVTENDLIGKAGR
jgi:hypothetical protein